MTRARAKRLLTDALNPRRTVQERGQAAEKIHKGSLKSGDRVANATWKKFTEAKQSFPAGEVK
jgi:hypothetical protein